jgi:hypothetical protein
MNMDFEEELPSTEEVANQLINDWQKEQNETEWEEHMDEMEIEQILEEYDNER